jgi:hypothetical protein
MRRTVFQICSSQCNRFLDDGKRERNQSRNLQIAENKKERATERKRSRPMVGGLRLRYIPRSLSQSEDCGSV